VGARLVAVGDAELAVSDWGSGESIVFLQTALVADELVPLADQPALDGFRKLLYYRRGYAGSRGVEHSRSITSDAEDARSLLTSMEIPRAHIVGVSYSGAIGLQLAAETPEYVQSLVVSEPPPLHTSLGPEFRAANERLLHIRHDRGVGAALEDFLTLLLGSDWRRQVEGRLPGAVAQIERDAATFFDGDIPALLDWEFGPAEAGRIECPVLYVGGTDSGPWFAEVREPVLGWLPHAEDVQIQGWPFAGDHAHAAACARCGGLPCTPPDHDWFEPLNPAVTPCPSAERPGVRS
jgi:pimeloyl-ACP methyl ester carboxylesterase